MYFKRGSILIAVTLKTRSHDDFFSLFLLEIVDVFFELDVSFAN